MSTVTYVTGKWTTG